MECRHTQVKTLDVANLVDDRLGLRLGAVAQCQEHQNCERHISSSLVSGCRGLRYANISPKLGLGKAHAVAVRNDFAAGVEFEAELFHHKSNYC